MKEKELQSPSGYIMLVAGLILLIVPFFTILTYIPILSVIISLAGFFIIIGLTVINPNEARVTTFFGDYVGTMKQNGLRWVNPLYRRRKISLRARNLNGQKLKVNDKLGNPIEIAAVVVWKVSETAKAIFEVDDYQKFVDIQSEAAVRHLASSYAYDTIEDEHASITLRDGSGKINEMLEKELNERIAQAGVEVIEARISHLSYAPEIAGAMLQRQQATAVVAARKQIVEGAVGMVEMALARLSEKEIVDLDEERKAAMVSNLLVVLCGEKSVSPVVNTGTLYN
ncbi:SPFH domain-containing protein [Emticicia sp. BO119]|uniref:SPFH domain-containing protein n=1 Tax=Emticicia sp. BO119 TaxID=2757768 RepID=UPI0015F10A62|nr:SPFH domain-containing protein [Emticicia sp. BO119]MBA4852792.1 SPFH domain-containing protein [Emticicia sp. BO119]